MKIALIAPPYPLEESPSPPLGLCYVAAACEAAGADVMLVDYIVQKYTPQKLAQVLTSFQPDVVGITSVTMNFFQAIKIIQDVKACNPEIITMMGGPHVSFDIVNTLSNYPELDLIVYGEGEETLLELVPRIHQYSQWENIRGIAFRSQDTVVVTPQRPLITDLDGLPFPSRHLLSTSRYKALGFPFSIITSRGCPNRCIFCLGRRMVGMKARFRSPKLVVDEIEQVLDLGIERINIADDLFTANKKRVKALCEEIIRRGVSFAWSAFARVNTVNLETVEIMQAAGCDTISFGIESGNAEMLKRIRKGITLNQVHDAVEWCKKAGIRTHASFMVGLPGETPETLHQTRQLAESLGIEYGYHFLAPFPGTTVREELDQYDLSILTNDWDLYDANQAIVETRQLSAKQLDDFVEKAYEKFFEIEAERELRYRQGQRDGDDYLLTEGRYRMNLIYKLLSEDMIAEQKVFPVNGTKPEDPLIANIIEMTGMEEDLVKRTIKSLAAAGHIEFKAAPNGISWFWSHRNQAKLLTIHNNQ